MNRPALDVIEARANETVLIARDDVPLLIAYVRELEDRCSELEGDQVVIQCSGEDALRERITELENALRFFAEPHIVNAEHNEQTSQVLVPREWCDLAASVLADDSPESTENGGES